MHGVGVGDAEGVADRRVGGRAPPLAEDVVAPAELDDVPHHEEVAREAQFLDHLQLVVDLDPGPRLPLGMAGPVAVGGALLRESPQVAHLVEPVGTGEGWEPGGHQRQVEGALQPESGGPGDHAGVAGEAADLLGSRSQAGPGRGRQPTLDLVEAAPAAHRGQRGGQRATGRGGVVDVVGRHHVDAHLQGDAHQGVVADGVERVTVVPQLDRHPVTTEGVDQAAQLGGGGGRAVVDQRPRHRPLPATGEHLPLPAVATSQVGQRRAGQALLPAPQVGGRDGPREPGVAVGRAGQDHQVVALRVGLAHLGPGQVEGELGAEHGGQADGPGRLGEADDAVEPVVVGDGQRLQPQPDRLLGQLLRMGGTVEEGEVGVAVQLGVGHHRPGRRPHRDRRRLVGLAHVGPSRAVAPVRPGRCRRPPAITLAAVTQPLLQLGPRHRRVPPSHGPKLSNTCSISPGESSSASPPWCPQLRTSSVLRPG